MPKKSPANGNGKPKDERATRLEQEPARTLRGSIQAVDAWLDDFLVRATADFDAARSVPGDASEHNFDEQCIRWVKGGDDQIRVLREIAEKEGVSSQDRVLFGALVEKYNTFLDKASSYLSQEQKSAVANDPALTALFVPAVLEDIVSKASTVKVEEGGAPQDGQEDVASVEEGESPAGGIADSVVSLSAGVQEARRLKINETERAHLQNLSDSEKVRTLPEDYIERELIFLTDILKRKGLADDDKKAFEHVGRLVAERILAGLPDHADGGIFIDAFHAVTVESEHENEGRIYITMRPPEGCFSSDAFPPEKILALAVWLRNIGRSGKLGARFFTKEELIAVKNIESAFIEQFGKIDTYIQKHQKASDRGGKKRGRESAEVDPFLQELRNFVAENREYRDDELVVLARHIEEVQEKKKSLVTDQKKLLDGAIKKMREQILSRDHEAFLFSISRKFPENINTEERNLLEKTLRRILRFSSANLSIDTTDDTAQFTSHILDRNALNLVGNAFAKFREIQALERAEEAAASAPTEIPSTDAVGGDGQQGGVSGMSSLKKAARVVGGAVVAGLAAKATGAALGAVTGTSPEGDPTEDPETPPTDRSPVGSAPVSVEEDAEPSSQVVVGSEPPVHARTPEQPEKTALQRRLDAFNADPRAMSHDEFVVFIQGINDAMRQSDPALGENPFLDSLRWRVLAKLDASLLDHFLEDPEEYPDGLARDILAEFSSKFPFIDLNGERNHWPILEDRVWDLLVKTRDAIKKKEEMSADAVQEDVETQTPRDRLDAFTENPNAMSDEDFAKLVIDINASLKHSRDLGTNPPLRLLRGRILSVPHRTALVRFSKGDQRMRDSARNALEDFERRFPGIMLTSEARADWPVLDTVMWELLATAKDMLKEGAEVEVVRLPAPMRPAPEPVPARREARGGRAVAEAMGELFVQVAGDSREKAKSIFDRAKQWAKQTQSEAYAKHVRGELTDAERRGERPTVPEMIAGGVLSGALTSLGVAVVPDVVRYMGQQKFIGLEREDIWRAVGDTIHAKRVQAGLNSDAGARLDALERRIESSRYLTDAQKKEMLSALNAQVDSVVSVSDKETVTRANREIDRILDNMIRPRVSREKVMKEAVNTGLKWGVAPLAVSGALLRAPVYGAISLAEGYQRMTREFPTASRAERLQKYVHEGFTQTYARLRGDQGRIAQAVAIGSLARSLGMTGVFVDALTDHPEVIDEFLTTAGEGIKSLSQDAGRMMHQAFEEMVAVWKENTNDVSEDVDTAPPTPYTPLPTPEPIPEPEPVPEPEPEPEPEAERTDVASAHEESEDATSQQADTPLPTPNPQPSTPELTTPEEEVLVTRLAELRPGADIDPRIIPDQAVTRQGDGITQELLRCVQKYPDLIQNAGDRAAVESGAEDVARLLMRRVAARDGVLDTWLSAKAVGNIATLPVYENGIMHVGFFDAHTGESLSLEEMKEQGFLIPAPKR